MQFGWLHSMDAQVNYTKLLSARRGLDRITILSALKKLYCYMKKKRNLKRNEKRKNPK